MTTDTTTTTTAPSIADPRAVSRDVFSATLGSVCCCYTGQPFDTIKVRMQTNPTSYPSFLSTAGSIFQKEGAVAFWKGAVPTAIGMAMENAMAFGVNEALKRAFPDPVMEGNTDGTNTPDLVKPFVMVNYCGRECWFFHSCHPENVGNEYMVSGVSRLHIFWFLWTDTIHVHILFILLCSSILNGWYIGCHHWLLFGLGLAPQ